MKPLSQLPMRPFHQLLPLQNTIFLKQLLLLWSRQTIFRSIWFSDHFSVEWPCGSGRIRHWPTCLSFVCSTDTICYLSRGAFAGGRHTHPSGWYIHIWSCGQWMQHSSPPSATRALASSCGAIVPFLFGWVSCHFCGWCPSSSLSSFASWPAIVAAGLTKFGFVVLLWRPSHNSFLSSWVCEIAFFIRGIVLCSIFGAVISGRGQWSLFFRWRWRSLSNCAFWCLCLGRATRCIGYPGCWPGSCWSFFIIIRCII